MVFLILAGLFLALSVICVASQIKLDRNKESNTGGYVSSALLMLALSVLITTLTINTHIKWQCRAVEYSFLDTIIKNKLVKIEMMKQSYRDLTYEPDMNVDLVNKDLTGDIVKEIRELETFINGKNVELAAWSVKKCYWFWNACFVPVPRKDPLKMSEWVNLSSELPAKGE